MNYNSHYFSRKAAAVFLNMDEWKSITCAWTWGIFTFGDFLNNLHIYFLLRTFFWHPKYAIWSIMTIGSLNPSLQVGWGFQFFFFFYNHQFPHHPHHHDPHHQQHVIKVSIYFEYIHWHMLTSWMHNKYIDHGRSRPYSNLRRDWIQKLCIPLKVFPDIFAIIHDDGHHGFARCFQVISRSWYVRNSTRQFREFTGHCPRCFILQKRRHKP